MCNVRLTGVICLLMSVGGSTAFAQVARPERPYRGIFAGGVGDPGKLLTAEATVSSGYDDDLIAEAAGVGTTTPGATTKPRQGTFASLSGTLAYTQTSDKFSFGGSATSSSRYYPSLEDRDNFIIGSQGRFAGAVQFSRNTSFSGSTSVAYQPFSFGGLFPVLFEPQEGEVTIGDLDLAVTDESYVSYEGEMSVSHQISQRASLSANYNYRTSEYSTLASSFGYHSAGGHFLYGLGKGVGLRAGYTYAQARYTAESEVVPHHQIDLGIDYSRTLSISRRTTLSFSTGTSAIQDRQQSESEFRYRAIGMANLNREIGRTWNASLAYSRQVELSEVWLEPVLYDALTAGTGGLINRRLRFSASVSGALGTVGAFAGAGSFDSYYASTDLTYAISRYMSMGVIYSYYHHRFEDGITLPVGALQVMDRQSARVGFTVWTPLFQRARRPHATR